MLVQYEADLLIKLPDSMKLYFNLTSSWGTLKHLLDVIIQHSEKDYSSLRLLLLLTSVTPTYSLDEQNLLTALDLSMNPVFLHHHQILLLEFHTQDKKTAQDHVAHHRQFVLTCHLYSSPSKYIRLNQLQNT